MEDNAALRARLSVLLGELLKIHHYGKGVIRNIEAILDRYNNLIVSYQQESAFFTGGLERHTKSVEDIRLLLSDSATPIDRKQGMSLMNQAVKSLIIDI